MDGKETFDWPSAQNFEVTDLGTMLPRGLVDTGDFATELRELFDGKSATFSALSQEQIGGYLLASTSPSRPGVADSLSIKATKAPLITASCMSIQSV